MTHVVAELIVANLGHEARLAAEARRGNRDIGCRATDRLLQGRYLAHRYTELLGIEIYAHPSNGEHFQSHCGSLVLAIRARDCGAELFLQLFKFCTTGHELGELLLRNLFLCKVSE